MHRTFLLLSALLSLSCKSRESKPPDVDHAPAVAPKTLDTATTPALLDLYGDPLPEGAIGRLGSLRMVDRSIRHMLFTSDGSQISGAILSGEIDARDLVGALVGGGLLEEEDPDAVCDLIGTFGVSCEACASDGAAYCLAIYVDQITANYDDQTLVAQDACDPEACAEGCEDTE